MQIALNNQSRFSAIRLVPQDKLQLAADYTKANISTCSIYPYIWIGEKKRFYLVTGPHRRCLQVLEQFICPVSDFFQKYGRLFPQDYLGSAVINSIEAILAQAMVWDGKPVPETDE